MQRPHGKIHFIIVCIFSLLLAACEGSVSYKPPLVPIEFSIDSTGKTSLEANHEFVTPFGVVTLGLQPPTIETSKQILVILRNEETQNDTIYIIDGINIRNLEFNSEDATYVFVDFDTSTIIIKVKNNTSYSVGINSTDNGNQTYSVDITSSNNTNTLIVNVPGSYQSELGCPNTRDVDGDWEPNCPQSAMKDLDSDGIYEFATNSIPAGDYEVKVALNGSWELNYGLDGERDGENIPFTVPRDNVTVTFKFDITSNILTVDIPEANSISVEVPSNMPDDEWLDSEIAVIKGQQFRLTSSGRIDVYPACEANNETEQVCSAMRFGPEGSQEIGTADPTYPLPGEYVGALIARIGTQGSLFLVADGGEFIANASGNLQFRINDYYLEDNIGIFTVIFEPLL